MNRESSTGSIALRLECTSCHSRYGLTLTTLLCEKCKGLLEVVNDTERLDGSIFGKRGTRRSIWRYREVLPVANLGSIVSLGEGSTPLIRPNAYCDVLGVKKLRIKLDLLNPTGSFKDRGTSVSVSKFRELRLSNLLDDSSGNAGASLAAYAAAAGMNCTLFVPSKVSPQKLLQAKMFGAKVVRVPGPRSKAERRAFLASKTGRAYYASHVLSPYFIEGTKTLAYELAEELTSGGGPDHLVFPVGGGSFILGVFKGYQELKAAGLVDRVPRLHGVQSQGCMPIVEAFRRGLSVVEMTAERETVAEGIRISNPPRGPQVLAAIRATGGTAVAVSDDAILEQRRSLARTSGVFAEATSCVPLAGVADLLGGAKIAADESVVVPITGSGLKEAFIT